jgi:hypothetical protein
MHAWTRFTYTQLHGPSDQCFRSARHLKLILLQASIHSGSDRRAYVMMESAPMPVASNSIAIPVRQNFRKLRNSIRFHDNNSVKGLRFILKITCLIIFFAFYKISQPNFANLLISLGCSLTLLLAMNSSTISKFLKNFSIMHAVGPLIEEFPRISGGTKSYID